MSNDPASLYMDQNNRRSENATRDQASYENKSASNLLNQDIKQALYQKNSNTIKDRNTNVESAHNRDGSSGTYNFKNKGKRQ